MYNACMSYRHDDTNWGKHGNPNRDEWFHALRGLNQLDTNHKDRPLFHDGTDLKVSVWTIFWVIAGILIISGFSETARGWVFYGVNIAEHWYAGVDSLLDALGAPKLP